MHDDDDGYAWCAPRPASKDEFTARVIGVLLALGVMAIAAGIAALVLAGWGRP